MTRTIDNSQDVIDSRDVIARIAELESDRDDLVSAIDEAKASGILTSPRKWQEDDSHAADCAMRETDAAECTCGKADYLAELEDAQDALDTAEQALVEWDENEDGQELKALKALEDEASGYAADWQYGEALIRDSYFKEYAQQLAEDIGAIKSDASWPNNCIDWEEATDQLKQDYTEVDFDGVAYWIR
jgi:hypothetical protein